MFRPPCVQGTLILNGGAEDLADDFNVRDPRKLYRLARQRDLDVTQAMAFEALKADVGRQVQAPRPRALGKSAAEGPNDRLQADLIDFSQNTRGKTKYGLVVMDVFTREAAVEPLQNKNAETVGRATKRAAKELTGDDGNFVVTTDLGNEFATLDRELPENAVHRTKRPEDRNAIAVVDRGIQTLKKDLATRVARKGGQWSDHFQQTASAYNARPHETVHGAPEDVEKQPATEFRVLQDNADKFQHNKDLTERGGGRGRLPSADERGEELQPAVRRRAAAADPAEAGAAGAAGQRQRGGPADETQAGGCEAAGRLPGASEAQDPRLAFLDIAQAGGGTPGACSSPFWRKTAQISLRSVPLLYVTRQAAEPPLGGGGCFPWVWGRKLKSYSLSALRFLPRASEVYILACTSANRLLRQNMPVLTEALTRQGPNIFLS